MAIAVNPGFKVTMEHNRGGSKRCESCTKSGPLHHLIMPKSVYRYQGVKTRYKEYWLCDECYEKLRAALEKDGDEEK